DIGQHEQMRYIATEYIEGETLRLHISRRRPTLTEIMQIVTQIVSALSAAHRAGIIHRDLKPENVMLRPDGLVKVLDFGLAKQTRHTPEESDDEGAAKHKLTTASGTVMGTPSYMSPEQARGGKPDARTDIFSLGVMLHEMIAGELPFQGTSSYEVIAAILERDPKPPTNAPPGLANIVNKSLQKDREQRYADIAEFQADLKEFEKELAQHPEWEERLKTGIEGSAPGNATLLDPGNEANPAIVTAPAKRPLWRRAGRLALRAIAVMVLLGLLAAGGVWFYDWIRKPAIDSIAVLPFANMDKNPDAEYLCVGLSDSLINNLSRMHGLTVGARGASFQFNSNDFDPQTVATNLGVRAIVSGSISQRNNRLQISAELMDTQTKKRLWGEFYDRPPGDLVAIQTEIAGQVADKLRVWLTKEVNARLATQRKIAPDAYNLFLKANYEGERGTIEGNKKAIELLNQAIAVEPQYTDAWLAIGGGYSVLAYQVRTSSSELSKEAFAAAIAEAEEYKKKSAAAFQKARDLDPTPAGLPQFAVRMQKLQENWDWDNLERESRYALKLAPNDPNILSGLSYLLSLRGQHDEAVDLMRRAYDFDPLSSSMANRYAQALMLARRYDEAIDLLKKKKETNKASLMTHLFLADCYKYKKMFPEAEAEFETAGNFFLVGGEVKNSINYQTFLISVGRRAEVSQALNKMLAAGDADGAGILYAMLGEKEKAFAELEQELTRRTPNMELLGLLPELDSLRDDPRFQEIIRKIGVYKPAR
ncbi:MAG TPA: protein kinase, partial [Blastocatellia bacterium]|nr:protein kinase [Blastocatellia bacterium]